MGGALPPSFYYPLIQTLTQILYAPHLFPHLLHHFSLLFCYLRKEVLLWAKYYALRVHPEKPQPYRL